MKNIDDDDDDIATPVNDEKLHAFSIFKTP